MTWRNQQSSSSAPPPRPCEIRAHARPKRRTPRRPSPRVASGSSNKNSRLLGGVFMAKGGDIHVVRRHGKWAVEPAGGRRTSTHPTQEAAISPARPHARRRRQPALVKCDPSRAPCEASRSSR
ncbi:MAG: DUF2188 domain-containing protein [Chloroflexi bacterium]|nr:MAG: DUF2188 domain-containing protein [Chloroflexota bacterium]